MRAELEGRLAGSRTRHLRERIEVHKAENERLREALDEALKWMERYNLIEEADKLRRAALSPDEEAP